MTQNPISFLRWICYSSLLAAACGEGHDGETHGPKGPNVLTACHAALPLVSHTAPAGQGPAALGDKDTDGNGILDRDEWGQEPVTPADSDGDASPDHEDLDDDGDGLLDVHDSERLTRLLRSDPFDFDNRLLLTFARVEIGEHELIGTARAADTLILEGEHFDCASIVTFAGSAGPINVVPTRASSNELHVLVPDGARDSVAVIRDGRASNVVPLSVVTPDAPVLFEPLPRAGRAGTVVAFRGENLAGVETVWFGSQPVPVTAAFFDRVEVLLPAATDGSQIKASTSSKTLTNKTSYRVLRTIQVHLPDVAAGNYVSDEVRLFQLWSEEVAPHADGGASIDVAADGSDVVRTVLERNGQSAPLFEAVALPADSALELDARSTAVSIVLGRSLALVRVHPDSRTNLRQAVSSLAEVVALGDALQAALANNPFARSADGPGFLAKLPPALAAFEAALAAALADGTLKPPPVPSQPSGLKEYLEEHQEPFTASTGPEITIKPEEQWFIRLSSPPGTGNVTVHNGSALYVSARIVDRETGARLSDHTSLALDGATINGDGLGLLTLVGMSPSSAFDQPKFRDARVEIVTPGYGKGTLSAEEQDVAFWLWWRTMFDNVVYPVFEFIVGKAFDPRFLNALLINHAKDMFLDLITAWRAGAVGDMTQMLIARAQSEVTSGPILPKLLGLLFDKAELAAVSGKISARLAQFLVPGLGELKVALEFFDAFTKGATIARTLFQVKDMDRRLDYDVTFGLGITKVIPNEMKQSCNGMPVIVQGAGFRPKTVNGAKQHLESTLSDPHPGGESPLVYHHPEYNTNTTGTEVTFMMPAGFSGSAVGPLGVELIRGEEQAELTAAIQITDRLTLNALLPNTAQIGDAIELTGDGFDQPGPIAVFFEEKTPPKGLAKSAKVSLFTSISKKSIQLEVPTLPSNQVDWRVWVQRGGAECVVRSEKLDFSTEPKACIMDLNPLSGITGGVAKLMALSESGNMLWREEGNVGKQFALIDGAVVELPCVGMDINDVGQVAGYAGANPSTAKFWDPKNPAACATLPVPAGSSPSIQAKAINNPGTIVTNAGFVWPTPASFTIPLTFQTQIDPKVHAVPRDINDKGEMVGWAPTDEVITPGNSTYQNHAALWKGTGAPVDLGFKCPGTIPYFCPEAISNAGHIVGYGSESPSGKQAALFSGGLTLLGKLNVLGSDSYATDVNDLGEVVGYNVGQFTSGTWSDKALIWLSTPAYAAPTKGMYLLSDFMEDPSWQILEAYGINNSGQIAARASYNGVVKAVLISLGMCAPAAPPTPQ